jgi:hypothetical protein
MKCRPVFYIFPHSDKIRYTRPQTFDWLGASRNVAQWKPHFTYRRQWVSIRTFHSYCPIWVKLAGDVHIALLLRLCQLRADLRGKGHQKVGMTALAVRRVASFKDHPVTACSLRYGAHVQACTLCKAAYIFLQIRAPVRSAQGTSGDVIVHQLPSRRDRQATYGAYGCSVPGRLSDVSYDFLQLIAACWLELHKLITCKHQNATLKIAALTTHP